MGFMCDVLKTYYITEYYKDCTENYVLARNEMGLQCDNLLQTPKRFNIAVSVFFYAEHILLF